MRFLFGFVALASITAAAVNSVEKYKSGLWDRDHLDRKTECVNGPTTRACWSDGFSINTDFDKNHPTTGKTVYYHFTITNGTCNPDGNGDRLCLLVDGQYPGPPIIANWGDTVSVTFTNKMKDNGTSIHFHGLRQLNSCGADGVPGITQCPIAPGQTYAYRFRATQFGTSWYHSHWSSQYGDGLLGTMIFHGPAAANYDIDLGAYPVTDWYYQTAPELALIARENSQNRRGPPNPSTILINGTNKDASGNGKYSHVTLTPGKKHLLRIVNTSLVAWIRVSLDNHLLQVIAADFVPVKPFHTQTILLGIGQRYDIIIDANQTAGNYWFRAEAAEDCIGRNGNLGLAVFTYSDAAVADPSTTAFPKPLQNCTEPTPVPFWDQPVPSQGFNSVLKTLDVGTTRAVQVPGGSLILVWSMNGSMDVQWELPTLSYFYNNDTDYASRSNVYPTLSEGSWNFWLIQTPLRIPHPIHLHGHDFFVLGQGKTTFNASNAVLNFRNPPRRDTATLYGFGWLALAWRSDNPGAWVMHCHIAFHVGEGLGVQFTESPANTVMPDRASFNRTCESWNKYYATAYYKKNDSGL